VWCSGIPSACTSAWPESATTVWVGCLRSALLPADTQIADAAARVMMRMRADGSQARGLTNNPNINYYDFDWDPSGSQLAVVRFDQTAMVEAPEIWLIDPLTSATSQWIVGGYAPLWIR